MVRSHRHTLLVVIPAMTIALAAMNISAASGYLFEHDAQTTTIRIVDTPTDGGIREEIPAKHRQRFEKWKAELLATEWGREQWNKYTNNRNFALTILVSGSREKGAAGVAGRTEKAPLGA